jgi:hypothetical protein
VADCYAVCIREDGVRTEQARGEFYTLSGPLASRCRKTRFLLQLLIQRSVSGLVSTARHNGAAVDMWPHQSNSNSDHREA